MIKEHFRNIALKENGKYYYHDKDISIGMGVRSPYVIHLVKFHYKGNNILIDNRTGTIFAANITCKFASHIHPIEFDLTSISPLANLFYRKKSRFKIFSDNENIKYFLVNNAAFKQLNHIALETGFSPEIYFAQEGRSNSMYIKYHLEFENWTQVLEPIIELYKNLIDEFEKGIKNIPLKSYKNKA